MSKSPQQEMEPEQLVKQANQLAREFYTHYGHQVPEDFRFDQSTQPEEARMWCLACRAIEMLWQEDAYQAAKLLNNGQAIHSQDSSGGHQVLDGRREAH